MGGQSFFAGERVENGNILEACFPGAASMGALGSLIEAILFARTAGVEPEVTLRSAVQSLTLVQKGLDDLVTRLKRQDFEETTATIAVYAAAVHAYQKTAASLSVATPYLDAFLGDLDAAQKAGIDRVFWSGVARLCDHRAFRPSREWISAPQRAG